MDVEIAAQLAHYSYNENGFPTTPAGWIPILPSYQDNYGFTGNAFYNSSTSTLVIGFGGTAGRSDLISDVKLAVTGTTNQEAYAVSYSGGVIHEFNMGVASGLYHVNGPVKVVMVGHSLGGVLAQRAQISVDGSIAMVFNSPGLGGFWGANGLHSDGVYYYYSNPNSWHLPSGAGIGGAIVTSGHVHNLGDLVNTNNVFFVLNAEGHEMVVMRAALEGGAIPISGEQWGAILAEGLRNGDIELYELGELLDLGYDIVQEAVLVAIRESGIECFLAGTPIRLPHGTKPIEDVNVGDLVLSYDASGTLVPGRVTRTFRNEVSHLLDVHGLKVTPGHATLCGDGLFRGRHVPIIDILLSDGALVQADGTLIRMAINAPVGATEDRFVKVAYALTAEDAQTGRLQEGEMRAGTLLFDRDGVPVSVLQCLTAGGYVFDPETGLVARPGEAPHPLYWFGRLPRPEDYILARSQETLEGILTDGEWEGPVSQLIEGRLRETRRRVN